jgi:(1->4)-alpha-D-glucan 1-alpha-D-glucosylmutase
MERKHKSGSPATASFPAGMVSPERIPRATYRLQFQGGFTFREAREILCYLDDLGISDLYASPLFQPCFDDSHGYDICSHTRFNPVIGTAEAFDAFAREIRKRGMGLILDLVPNHMGIAGDRNRWWMDVLENGPSSNFADYFDIDWHPAKPELENKVLLPILEDQYGKVLESGKFQLVLEEGAFFIHYYQNTLPVAPRTYSMILSQPLGRLNETLGKDHPHLQELQSILTAIGYLPTRTELTPEKMEERNREKEVVKRRLAALYQQSPEIRAALDETVRIFNGAVGDPRSFDLLDALLKDQAYRPAFWRVASDEINYRRFFDIDNLAAIRMEAPEVFEEAHRLVLRLLKERKVSGLRIDHPDGLWKPAEYFKQLQQNFACRILEARRETPARTAETGEGFASSEKEKGAGCDPEGIGDRPLYVVAEKILCESEELPSDWAISGTTGYDFLNLVNGLFVDSRNEKAFDRIYSHFIGTSIPLANLVNSSKKMIMLVSLSSEIHALAHRLERIIETNRRYRDFTLNSLTFVLREIIACLPVYRTYISETRTVTPRDRSSIETAVGEAKRRNPRTAEAIFDFIRETLLLQSLPDFSEEDQRKLIQFVMKFQQITGPVMAKGVEDTAFYVYNRLASLNEVGGHPDCFGVPAAEFHKQNRKRLISWPSSLLTTSTHDTKRGEDVRARLNVLSEIPGEWRAALSRWSRRNSAKKTAVDGQPAPDRNDEYLFYQSLIGAWPSAADSKEAFDSFRERISGYMLKAVQEAKVHTSWVNPNEEYITAIQKFIAAAVASPGENPFLDDIRDFQRRIAYFGYWNSLAQVLLKLTSPGVPDMYQGGELWDLNLVDPDNRWPVDFEHRQTLLRSLLDQIRLGEKNQLLLARELMKTPWDPQIKLFVVAQTLRFRRQHPNVFWRGDYISLEGTGEKKDFFVSFARYLGRKAVMVVIPRLVVGLMAGVEKPPVGKAVWKDTKVELPARLGTGFQNVFTGVSGVATREGGKFFLPLAEGMSDFPIALLEFSKT